MAKVRALSYALASLAFAGIALFGCSDSGHGTSPQAEEQTQNDTGINVLTSVFPSPKEQNPYSVENMNKTFKDLVLANNPNAKDIPKLEANFLYVRFLPYGKQGVHELRNYDTALVLFRHPMDYNDIMEPAVYVDKTLPDSIIPYFASVPVGYEFGPTPYEILQELFLTQPLEEQDGDSQEGSRFVRAKKSNKASKKIADYLKSQGLAPYHLEMMAFPDTERFYAEGESGSGKALVKNIPLDADNIGIDNIVAWSLPWKKTWRPSGTLKFIDTVKINNTVKAEHPLVGVRVTSGYKFYWRSDRTDSKGNFSNPEKWSYSVDYEVHFDSYQFLLEDGHVPWYYLFGETLKITNKGTKSAWNPIFEGKRAKYCVIWTAAWNYWEGYPYVERPRQKKTWNQSMNLIVYYEKNDFDAYGRYRNLGIFEDIQIQAYNRGHIGIYGTTIHEIAHSSHYYNMKTDLPNIARYALLSDTLKESYARGVQRYLTIKRYGTWSGDYSDWAKGYTGLFEDLEDTDSTFAQTSKYCDKVSGITVPMAEKVFFKSYSWNGFKNNLMKEYPNGASNDEGGKVTYTTADMDVLFKYWETGEGAAPCSVPVTSTAKPSSPNAVAGSLTDTRDKKVYETVVIGTQTWMTENLSYNAAGSKCYGNYAANCDKHGRLYDWATALDLPSSCNSASCSGQVKEKHKGICPSGWHIPSMEDWNKLMRYVDKVDNTRSPYDSPTAGIHLKSISGWYSGWIGDIWYGGSGKDTYGFSALPGGYYSSTEGSFKNTGYNGDWWSTAEYDGSGAYRFDLYYGDKAGWSDIGGANRRYDKANLFSIRCLKD
ncbi:MAG: fibrobacter succinogenes major paralogous domain-containing protein [Fibromonadaceae bacterium]|nr:fibrobacter succinogenes major paralogous domain-containing protein [Fibromonadaceae bacterium]